MERARTRRRGPAALLAACAALAGCGAERVSLPAQPRLVVLYATCTLNKDYLAPYRPGIRYTPSLEAFARDSVVFERHVTEAGVSGIAYASIVSGAQVDVHQVYQHPRVLDEELYLVTEAFADAGYDTHYWQGHKMASARLRYAQGVPEENVHGIGTVPAVKAALQEGDEDFTSLLQNLKRDPDYKAMILVTFTVTHAAYNAQVLSEELERFLRLYPEEVHGVTVEEAERFGELYAEHRLALQWNYAATVKKLGLTPHEEARLAAVLEVYYKADVGLLDVLFGRMVATLRRTGLYDDALIAFTADHGEVLARDNALFRWGHGLQLAPEVLNVPWILHLPAGVERPPRFGAVTRSIDVYPTLAGLCGLRLPRDARVQGNDLSPALLRQEAPPEVLGTSHTKVLNEPLMELFRDWPWVRDLYPRADPDLMWVSARRGDTFFRVRHLGEERWANEVFDLVEDPGTRRNLYDDANREHEQVFAWLSAYKRRLVDAWSSHDLSPEEVEESLRGLGYIK